MASVYQNVYGFNPKNTQFPMSGCSAHTNLIAAVERGLRASNSYQPYCGTLEYVMDGTHVTDVKFYPKSIG